MLSFSVDYLHEKNLGDHLIPSRDIDDQRMQQSAQLRGRAGHTQAKVAASYATFL